MSVVPDSSPLILAMSLRCDHRAPRLARQALEGPLAIDPVLDDARLVASELVSDAVLYSGCQTDDIMRVMARREGGFLVLSVHVPGPPLDAPKLGRHENDLGTERLGRRVIAQLAERWGSDRPGKRPDGRHVWAALPVSRAGGRGRVARHRSAPSAA